MTATPAADLDPRPAYRVEGPVVVPARSPGFWLAVWNQPGSDPDAWCECPWELWRLGVHVCSARRRLLDGWQAAHLRAFGAPATAAGTRG
jgi:hypothetical protein